MGEVDGDSVSLRREKLKEIIECTLERNGIKNIYEKCAVLDVLANVYLYILSDEDTRDVINDLYDVAFALWDDIHEKLLVDPKIKRIFDEIVEEVRREFADELE